MARRAYPAETAAYLTAFYNRKFYNCNRSESQAAFLCSGVTLRLTIKALNNEYKTWKSNPTAIAMHGVSFSYLRILEASCMANYASHAGEAFAGRFSSPVRVDSSQRYLLEV